MIYPASMDIYIKTDKLVEKLTKIMYFLLTRVSAPSFVLPKFFASFFLYFTTDTGNNAFELPLPMWWVCNLYSLTVNFNKDLLSTILHLSKITIQKVSIWLEKSHWIFDCCFVAIRISFHHLLLSRMLDMSCIWYFFHCTFANRRCQRRLKFNQPKRKI